MDALEHFIWWVVGIALVPIVLYFAWNVYLGAMSVDAFLRVRELLKEPKK